MDYIIKHNVPILDEHVLKDEEGKEIATIDKARLQKIADLGNKRVKDTGDECPIIIGHTKDDTDEKDQPEIVGWASNYKVGKFLKTGKKALTCTMKFLKKHMEKIKKHPRRSIELWLNDWKVDPISLLGATTPERDLGLLQFSKGGVKKFSIPYKGKMTMNPDSDQKGIVDAVMKAIEQSDWYKFLQEQMTEAGASEEGAVSPDEEADLDGGGMDEGAGLDGMEPEEEAQASAALTPPPEEEQPMKLNKGACKMAKQNQERIKQHRYAKLIDAQNKKIADLQIKFRKSEREKDLIQLEAEGVDFDRTEELEDVLDLPEKQYQKHIQKMRIRYQKSIGGRVEASRDPYLHQRTPQATPVDRRNIVDQAVQMAQEKGISFEQALSNLE